MAFFLGGLLIDTLGDVGGAAGVVGAVAFAFGAVGFVRVARVRRLASKDGWRQRSALFRMVGRGNGQPALLLAADDHEPEAVVSVSTTVFRWNALAGVQTLWVTGDPLSRFAAVATPGFEHVIVVKRPLLPWWRGRLRQIATST